MKVNISGDSAQTIFESVKALCGNGELKAGDVLPPVRELAQQLGVNRNTVASAYQRLVTARIAIAQGRLGTRICEIPSAGEQEGKSDTALFDLADGSPRKEWLPDLNEIASQTHLNQFLYGEATTLPELQRFSRDWFSQDCPEDFDISLSNGAIDALERLMAAHLSIGDKIVVEDPCYISSANAIRLAGMQTEGAETDEYGMRPDRLQAALKKGAQAVLLTPRAHNPTGASLSEQRANELKTVLADFPNVLIMLDDHFSLLATTAYHSVIPDSTRHWALFRSVSKGLGPDLRVALMAADRATVKLVSNRLAPGMSWVSRILQSFVLSALTSESIKNHLSQAKQNCAERRMLLINALTEQGIKVTTTVDGLNVWVPVKKPCQSIAFELSRRGWLVRPGNSFDIQRESQALRVSLSHIEPEIAQKFARDLSYLL